MYYTLFNFCPHRYGMKFVLGWDSTLYCMFNGLFYLGKGTFTAISQSRSCHDHWLPCRLPRKCSDHWQVVHLSATCQSSPQLELQTCWDHCQHGRDPSDFKDPKRQQPVGQPASFIMIGWCWWCRSPRKTRSLWFSLQLVTIVPPWETEGRPMLCIHQR